MTRKRRASDKAEDGSTFDIEHRPRTGITDWNLGLMDQAGAADGQTKVTNFIRFDMGHPTHTHTYNVHKGHVTESYARVSKYNSICIIKQRNVPKNYASHPTSPNVRISTNQPKRLLHAQSQEGVSE